jgi:hypothetical protein
MIYHPLIYFENETITISWPMEMGGKGANMITQATPAYFWTTFVGNILRRFLEYF